MKSYFYPKSLYTSIVAFADQFNDMSVRVYDQDGRIVGVKPVVMTLAPKEKIASILLRSDTNDVDPQVDNYLPRISVNKTGITWDANRMRGKFDSRLVNIEYLDYESGDNKPTKREMQIDLKPIPYNLSFEVIIWTKYETDMQQILENILPWFAPEDHLSIKERNFGIERKSKVSLDNISINNQFELGESDRRILQTVMTFTMETVVYKPMEIRPEILCSIISIAEVPCNRRPMQGEKIILTDDGDIEPFCLEDRDIACAIEHLDDMDSYDLMVKYWKYANNNMKPMTYLSCITKTCNDEAFTRPVWDAESGYSPCDPPIHDPYLHFPDPSTSGSSGGPVEPIIWYFQETITGEFSVPDDRIDGWAEEDLPPLNPDGTRTFGSPDIINVWYFKRFLYSQTVRVGPNIIHQEGDDILDENGNPYIFLITEDEYPEIQDGVDDEPQDIPPELGHLADE